MLDLARVFSTFTLEREWIYICTSARGFSYPSGKAKKKKTRLSFFTSLFLLYGPFYWLGIFNVRWTYKQGDDGNRKAFFFLSIFLSSLSFVLLIRLDFYPQWNSNNEIWCALICMWQFLSALSDRFTHISLHFPRHKKKMSVAGSAITTPSPRPRKSFQIWFDLGFFSPIILFLKDQSIFQTLPVWLLSPGYVLRPFGRRFVLLFFLIFILLKEYQEKLLFCFCFRWGWNGYRRSVAFDWMAVGKRLTGCAVRFTYL